jgi:hypothetical protein
MSSDPVHGSTAAKGSSGDSGSSAQPLRPTSHDTSYDRDRIPVREERVQARPVQVREERVEHINQPVPQSAHDSRPVNVAVGAERQDGVRWGPVWAGLLTALTTFLLLELLFYAFGWLDLDPGAGSSSGLVTGILALVAFFIGGLIAGATALWKGLFSGLLHGFLVWALGVVAIIALTFFGAGALLGSFGSLTNQLGVGPQEVQSATDVSKTETNQASSTAKDAAAPAFWGLFLPLGAAMVGGLIGSKIWPRKDDSDPETVRLKS